MRENGENGVKIKFKFFLFYCKFQFLFFIVVFVEVPSLTAKQRNSETAKQRNSETAKQRNSETPDSFMILDYKQGKPVFFDTLIKDQNVLLNFWATYCVPCKKEIPEIIKTFGSNPKIKIYFVNVDEASEEAKAKEMMAGFGIEDRSLLDQHRVAAEEFIKPKLSVPANIVINKEGTIIYESLGYRADTIKKLKATIDGIKE
jgi:thiol-disulfide isomerase/thioredoxin